MKKSIISFSDKRLSSFFTFFYPFPYTFFVLILSHLNGTCILFCRHIWAELSFLCWTFLSRTFFQVGGGGVHVHPPPTCVRACRRCNFPFRKRSLPFETVVAIFETVVVIHNSSCHFNPREQ